MYKTRPNYKRYLQDYIINYKVKQKNKTNNIAHFFKKVLIDASQNFFQNIDTTKKLFSI